MSREKLFLHNTRFSLFFACPSVRPSIEEMGDVDPSKSSTLPKASKMVPVIRDGIFSPKRDGEKPEECEKF